MFLYYFINAFRNYSIQSQRLGLLLLGFGIHTGFFIKSEVVSGVFVRRNEKLVITVI